MDQDSTSGTGTINMYESYWNLHRRPFQQDGNAEFLFRGGVHQAALLKLRYAIEQQLDAAMLTGGVGYGKSYLCRALEAELPEAFQPIVNLVFPQLSPLEFLCWLAVELGVPEEEVDGKRLNEVLRHLQNQLRSHHARGCSPTIIIDEAHTIQDPELLDVLQMLLNFQQRSDMSLTLLLVGDRSLCGQVRQFAALDERIPIRATLKPFSQVETAEYVKHRLGVAGQDGTAFDASALSAIFELSGGVPRRINRICDLALLVGYADQIPTLTRDEIEAVGEELDVGLTV